jgi:ATP-binding cassette, subfamily G (WHITE), member 2, SNQ2
VIGNHPQVSDVPCSDELGPNQVCTLFGARTGSPIVFGKDYIKVGYDLNTDDLWRRDFAVLVAFFIFFWITQTVVIEIFPVSIVNVTIELLLIMSLPGQQLVWSGGVSFFVKDTSTTKKLNEELKTRKAQKAEEERLEKIRAMDGIKKKREPYVSWPSELLSTNVWPPVVPSLTEKLLLGKG